MVLIRILLSCRKIRQRYQEWMNCAAGAQTPVEAIRAIGGLPVPVESGPGL